MINAGFVDFLFTGKTIVPEFPLLADDLVSALLGLLPLLVVAWLVHRQHARRGADHPAPAASELNPTAH